MNRSYFSFVLFVILVVLLSACAGPAASVGSPASAGTDGCLGDAKTALVDLGCRKVTIAVENVYLPFNYISVKTGEAGGWDYDAWREICTRLRCTPVFTEVGWDSMIQSVADGQYDVAADGITITEDRAKQVDFSDGYIQIEQRLLVRKGENRFAKIQDFVDNPNLMLAAQSSTTNYETAAKYLPENRIKAFDQMPFAVQALLSGDVDAVMIDAVVGLGYMGQNADQLQFLDQSISSDELGFAFPKGSSLVQPVNQALASMKADGTLESINKKYFGPDFKLTSDDIQTGD